MNPRLGWLLCAAMLAAHHVAYHVASREPGTPALILRLALVGLLFAFGSAARRERIAARENKEQ